ncbi:hypothetical protein WDW89_11905 [Deltaproteobacteria bacterium TL4]
MKFLKRLTMVTAVSALMAQPLFAGSLGEDSTERDMTRFDPKEAVIQELKEKFVGSVTMKMDYENDKIEKESQSSLNGLNKKEITNTELPNLHGYLTLVVRGKDTIMNDYIVAGLAKIRMHTSGEAEIREARAIIVSPRKNWDLSIGKLDSHDTPYYVGQDTLIVVAPEAPTPYTGDDMLTNGFTWNMRTEFAGDYQVSVPLANDGKYQYRGVRPGMQYNFAKVLQATVGFEYQERRTVYTMEIEEDSNESTQVSPASSVNPQTDYTQYSVLPTVEPKEDLNGISLGLLYTFSSGEIGLSYGGKTVKSQAGAMKDGGPLFAANGDRVVQQTTTENATIGLALKVKVGPGTFGFGVHSVSEKSTVDTGNWHIATGKELKTETEGTHRITYLSYKVFLSKVNLIELGVASASGISQIDEENFNDNNYVYDTTSGAAGGCLKYVYKFL